MYKLATKNYIVKNSLPEAADYELLRKEGLAYIEKLSSKLWTDYNIHDPGISILELLCYAITDLGYRTSFDVADLIKAKEGQEKPGSLFSAREILSNNPVSLNDFRKVLIDIEGVKNAWISMAEEAEEELYIDCKASKLKFEEKPGFKELNIKGLYNITLELDEDLVDGDLNDYSFELVHDTIDFIANLPTWDYLFKRKIDPSVWKYDSFVYIAFDDCCSLHKTAIVIRKGTNTMKIPMNVLIDDSMAKTVAQKEKIKNIILDHLAAGGAEKIWKMYAGKAGKAIKIARSAMTKLQATRNLCEDYKEVNGIDIEDIGLCAEVEIEAGADVEEVHARILFEVGNFLAPDVSFYSLKDMLDEGLSPDNIFEGPALDHGFIRDEELLRSEIPEEIHVSDLINIIMDIEGVLAIRSIRIASSYRGEVINRGEEWILKLGKGRAPRLHQHTSVMTFYKGLIPYFSDREQLALSLKELEHGKRSAKLKKDLYDLEFPEGKYLDTADYISIQEDLPLVYGTSSKGIPGLVDDKRKGQAKQLKAYLSLYDQLLANYLAQLRHIGDLFSTDPSIARTNFFQLLYTIPEAGETSLDHLRDQVPEIYKLIEKFTSTLSVDIDDFSAYKSDWISFAQDEANDFVESLKLITEDQKTFEDRRNRFLDHLMGRFAEQFTDYVLLMYEMEGPVAPQKLIFDKILFLQDYPEISANRGKAFDYTQCQGLWGSESSYGGNVSGYLKRLSRLSGITRYDRRYLNSEEFTGKYTIFKGVDGQWYFHFGIAGNVLLQSEGYTAKHNCKKGVESVLANGEEFENYELMEASDHTFYYRLRAKNGELIGRSPFYETASERNAKLRELIALFDDEGLHLVEHILLRPESEDFPLMPVCLDKDCNNCPGLKDPYSFRMTLVLPAWLERFRNMDFRRHFEYTARLEAPAHVHIKICWVDEADMIRFEKAFKAWLQAKCKDAVTPAILEKLIKALTEIKSIYPEAMLHDCVEEEDENPLVLGQTSIGSEK